MSATHPLPSPSARAARGVRILDAPSEAHLEEAAALVETEYWNEGVARDRLVRAMLGSTVCVVAIDDEGEVVATARALSDGARSAWVGDVCVAPAWRGRGVGKAVVRALLEHPRVRDADRVRLNTRDAQSLYTAFGFVETLTEKRAFPSHEMVLRRR
jgi:ribosomal protein S18 acetylase RimI-like enzyme